MKSVSFIPGTLRPETDHYVQRRGRPNKEWIPENLQLAIQIAKGTTNMQQAALSEQAWKKMLSNHFDFQVFRLKYFRLVRKFSRCYNSMPHFFSLCKLDIMDILAPTRPLAYDYQSINRGRSKSCSPKASNSLASSLVDSCSLGYSRYWQVRASY